MAGPPLAAADALDAVRSITWSAGHLWVIDGAATVRHYLDVGDEACALLPQRDLTFGAALSDSPRWLAADGAGHVYVSSASTTLRLTGDAIDYTCAVGGRLAVSPSGEHGFALFGSGPARRIRFGAEGCEVSEWAPLEAPSILESISFFGDERLLVGGQRGREGAHVVRPYDLEGAALGAAVGSSDASAMDRLCYAHAAWPCGEGTCVLDGNCRSLLWLDRDLRAQARLDVHTLTRLWAPWVVPPTRVDHGMTFFAAAQPEVDEAGARRFAATIYRLHGL